MFLLRTELFNFHAQRYRWFALTRTGCTLQPDWFCIFWLADVIKFYDDPAYKAAFYDARDYFYKSTYWFSVSFTNFTNFTNFTDFANLLNSMHFIHLRMLLISRTRFTNIASRLQISSIKTISIQQLVLQVNPKYVSPSCVKRFLQLHLYVASRNSIQSPRNRKRKMHIPWRELNTQEIPQSVN